jgi:hypothetical protein
MITITAVIRAKSGHEVTMRNALVAVAAYVAANEPETIRFFISQRAGLAVGIVGLLAG